MSKLVQFHFEFMIRYCFSIALIIFIPLLSGCSKKFAPEFEKALSQYSEEKYIGAIDSINLALSVWKESDGKGNRGQAYQLLGLSYHKLNKIGKATEAYNQAIKLSTNAYQSAHNLGFIYLSERNPELAAKSFQSALRWRPDDPASLLGLGNAHYALKNYKLAKLNFKRILVVSPGVKDALENLRVIDKKLAAKKPKKKKSTKKKKKKLKLKRSRR